MEAEQVKAISQRINALLPDDPHMAITVCALNFANVVVATGCDDESAIEVIRRALKQMRQGTWWMDS